MARGGNLALELGFDGVHDVLDKHGDLLEIDGTLVAGGADGADEFLAVEFFAAAVAFDDDHAVADEGLASW